MMWIGKQDKWVRPVNIVILVLALANAPGLFAQTTKADKVGQPQFTAPVPPQILAAKKIFIANDPGPILSANATPFGGGQDRAYTNFYSSMKAWGRYEIVANPSDADLIFEIRLISGQEVPTQFRLTIRDPKTNVLIWRLYQQIELGLLPGNEEKNFDKVAAPQLITKIAALIGAPLYPLSPQK